MESPVKLNTPTQVQFQIVIDTLIKAKKLADSSDVDMAEGNVNVYGSPMCHGGWYAFICYSESLNWMIDYTDGGDRMARDLGFDAMWELEEWAEQNPNIWGNKHGGKMFYDDEAFGTNHVTKLSTIINHWKKVKSRAAKYENANTTTV